MEYRSMATLESGAFQEMPSPNPRNYTAARKVPTNSIHWRFPIDSWLP